MASNPNFLSQKQLIPQEEQYFVVNRWTGNLNLINKPGFLGRFFYPLIYSSDVKKIWDVVEEALQVINKTQTPIPLENRQIIKKNVEGILSWGKIVDHNWENGPERATHDKVAAAIRNYFPAPAEPHPPAPQQAPARPPAPAPQPVTAPRQSTPPTAQPTPASPAAHPAPARKQAILEGPHFYPGRIGFENRRLTCSYISLSIVYAHTGVANQLLEKGFPQDYAEKTFDIKQMDRKINEFKDSVDFYSKAIEKQEKEIAELQQKLSNEIATNDIRKTMPPQKRPEKLVQMISKSEFEIEVLQGKIDEIKGKVDQNKSILYTQQTEFNRFTEDRPKKISQMNETNQQNLIRAREILKTLQTATSGSLPENDARLFHGVVHQLASGNGDITTRGGEADDVFEDRRLSCNVNTLASTIKNPDWRVIRAGGHGHWWAYVRNPDGQTVTEINDASIQVLPISYILNRWSNPDEWRSTQLTLYSVAG